MTPERQLPRHPTCVGHTPGFFIWLIVRNQSKGENRPDIDVKNSPNPLERVQIPLHA
jgi:hypothetical protein